MRTFTLLLRAAAATSGGLLLACGGGGASAASPASDDASVLADATADDGSSDGAVDTSDAGDAGAAGDSAASDACVDDPDAVAPACSEAYSVPPANLPGWTAALSRTGAMTLTHDTGHSHDDGVGPLGFCPAQVACGRKYLALVSARFETDQQDQSFPVSTGCVVDYTQPDPVLQQYGMCWSGGNHNIYVELRDESGKRITVGDGFEAFAGGQTWPVADQNKPPNEFPMNFPMAGHQNQIYGVRATYTDPVEGPLPSDAVTNMRLPLNHHVNYLLTFQIETR